VNCKTNVCQAATCSDGIKNEGEADIDCAGPCPVCATGKTCGAGTDCASKVCSTTCQAPSCSDKVTNGNETGVDCGGTSGCGACPNGQGCTANGDCQSGICASGTCTAAGCGDGLKNGGESDVDCGGATTCNRCANGQTCTAGSDCVSGYCNGTTCATGTSCKALHDGGLTTSGTYTIDIDGAGSMAPFAVYCDMTTNGGGWTQITLDLAKNVLGGTMVAVDPASTSGFDSSFRPYTQDLKTSGSVPVSDTYEYTFNFPAGYTQFFLSSYQLRANGATSADTSDLTPSLFHQTVWTTANLPATSCTASSGNVGDVSFGTPASSGPVTSYAALLTAAWSQASATLNWPGNTSVYTVPSSTQFRIGWGEAACAQTEGWYPWWSGTIMLR
jgi:hypothetical protein